MTNADRPNSAEQRVTQARALLSQFSASGPPGRSGGWMPAWSSAALEETVSKVLNAPAARTSDLFQALWALLAESGAALTSPMANFLRDVVVVCFTQYRSKYELDDFGWMASSTPGCSEAQAFFALHALPDTLLRGCQDAVLLALHNSTYLAEAEKMLSEE